MQYSRNLRQIVRWLPPLGLLRTETSRVSALGPPLRIQKPLFNYAFFCREEEPPPSYEEVLGMMFNQPGASTAAANHAST